MATVDTMEILSHKCFRACTIMNAEHSHFSHANHQYSNRNKTPIVHSMCYKEKDKYNQPVC